MNHLRIWKWIGLDKEDEYGIRHMAHCFIVAKDPIMAASIGSSTFTFPITKHEFDFMWQEIVDEEIINEIKLLDIDIHSPNIWHVKNGKWTIRDPLV